MKPSTARYSVATLTTKDKDFSIRVKKLMQGYYTFEQIVRRGVEELEQDDIKSLPQNNIA